MTKGQKEILAALYAIQAATVEQITALERRIRELEESTARLPSYKRAPNPSDIVEGIRRDQLGRE